MDSVDFIDGLPGLVRHAQPTVLPLGAPILISGWTIDPVTGGAPQAVCMLLDRARPFEARIGVARGDAMLAQGLAEEFIGYQVVVTTGHLSSGPHELRAYALSIDGSWYDSAVAGFWLFQHDRGATGTGTVDRELLMHWEQPIDAETGQHVAPGTPFHLNSWILFRGWTYDKALDRGAETIVVNDRTGRTWSGPGILVSAAGSAAVGTQNDRLGFELVIPARILGRGRHRIQIAGLDAKGRRYANFADVSLDVISARQPFPLAARVAGSPLPCAARLRAVDADRVTTLPANGIPIGIAPGIFAVEGWALDENGATAEEVFAELTVASLDLPPQRFAGACARRVPVAGMDAPPVDDAWFSCPFTITENQRGLHTLALVVVQPGRRSYSRVPLATVQIG